MPEGRCDARLRVLGVDPGLTRCGVGVVEGPPSRPEYVDGRCISTGSSDALETRLASLHDELAKEIDRLSPDVLACERVLFSANARTAMAVGQAAGVALLAAAKRGVPVVSYSPNDVKLTVAGHGAADKDAVARMVVAQLRLSDAPRPVDVTDALAVALCHLARARLSEATSRGSGSAADQLAEAAASARAASSRGWESVLEKPHIRESSPGTERT